MAEFGVGPDGRIFRGERNEGEIPRLTVVKAWRAARAEVFTPEVFATPLAERPYDLRHAAVSGWLNAGIPPADVAEWAGHSVEVLLRIYAKCLDGGTAALRARLDDFLQEETDGDGWSFPLQNRSHTRGGPSDFPCAATVSGLVPGWSPKAGVARSIRAGATGIKPMRQNGSRPRNHRQR